VKSSDQNRTIEDFGEQWTRYTDNEGWYGSLELFQDMLGPLLSTSEIEGATVAEIGSGTGRIVSMLLAAGAARVVAIEPSEAFEVLVENVAKMNGGAEKVVPIRASGHDFETDLTLDFVFSIGVLHHIVEPGPVVRAAFDALAPGGRIFVWLYGREGNRGYLALTRPLRAITVRLPHPLLKVVVEIVYGLLAVYRQACRALPLPLRSYLEEVLWPMSPKNRRLVIYDQLNPAHAKYYREGEARSLLAEAGFEALRLHHRHGYSWSVIGTKPAA